MLYYLLESFQLPKVKNFTFYAIERLNSRKTPNLNACRPKKSWHINYIYKMNHCNHFQRLNRRFMGVSAFGAGLLPVVGRLKEGYSAVWPQ